MEKLIYNAPIDKTPPVERKLFTDKLAYAEVIREVLHKILAKATGSLEKKRCVLMDLQIQQKRGEYLEPQQVKELW